MIAHRRLGSEGPVVFPLGLGCMGMSGMYGSADERTSVATIHAALERGITFLVASHDPAVISRAHRVFRLADGRLVGEDVP